jgi:Lecithin retinol acyltransferase
MQDPAYDSGELIGFGDWVKVFVPRLGVWHHGIVYRIFPTLGGFVVEIAHNMKATGVAVSDWYVFADSNPILLMSHASSLAHVDEILARVEANIGRPYHLFAQNCEHFASFAFNGKAESKSVKTAVGVLAVGAIIWGFFGG